MLIPLRIRLGRKESEISTDRGINKFTKDMTFVVNQLGKEDKR
jgi:hypothetical protein